MVKKIKIKKEKQMVFKKSWDEFRESGFLWFVNMILHTFGWAIVFEFDDNDNITNVYPARVKFRGFSDSVNSEGYLKVTKYMKENADKLLKEAKE